MWVLKELRMLFKFMPRAANVAHKYPLGILNITPLHGVYQKSMLSVDHPLPFVPCDGGICPAVMLSGIPKSLHH